MIVTTGLDPVVHGDIRRMRLHGERERAGSLHGLPDQVFSPAMTIERFCVRVVIPEQA
jgi:hypothetical protein